MSIEYYYYEGHPTVAISPPRRTLGALFRHGAFHRKVGITNNPETRWGNGYRKYGWSRMRVVYRSDIREHTQEIERLLIKSFDITSTGGWYYNAVGGGGGRKPKSGPYWVYVVTGPKYSRII